MNSKRIFLGTLLLAVFLILPASGIAAEGGSSGGMMGGGMMGQGMMGGHGMSMKKMMKHHKEMGEMMGMFKKSLVILKRTEGVSAADRAELDRMIKRVGEIIESHRSMMKGMKGMKDGKMME